MNEGMRHRQMASTQQTQRHACSTTQASGGSQPQSHLVIYHIQTLSVAAFKTTEDDWVVNRGKKNNMASTTAASSSI